MSIAILTRNDETWWYCSSCGCHGRKQPVTDESAKKVLDLGRVHELRCLRKLEAYAKGRS